MRFAVPIFALVISCVHAPAGQNRPEITSQLKNVDPRECVNYLGSDLNKFNAILSSKCINSGKRVLPRVLIDRESGKPTFQLMVDVKGENGAQEYSFLFFKRNQLVIKKELNPLPKASGNYSKSFNTKLSIEEWNNFVREGVMGSVESHTDPKNPKRFYFEISPEFLSYIDNLVKKNIPK